MGSAGSRDCCCRSSEGRCWHTSGRQTTTSLQGPDERSYVHSPLYTLACCFSPCVSCAASNFVLAGNSVLIDRITQKFHSVEFFFVFGCRRSSMLLANVPAKGKQEMASKTDRELRKEIAYLTSK